MSVRLTQTAPRTNAAEPVEEDHPDLAYDQSDAEAISCLRVVSERAQCKRERQRRQFLLHDSTDAPVGIQLTCSSHAQRTTDTLLIIIKLASDDR